MKLPVLINCWLSIVCAVFFSCSESAVRQVEKTQGDTSAAAKNVSLSANLAGEKATADTAITLDYVMGKFDPAKHPLFTKVDKHYADEEGRFLRKETYDAFRQVHDAAAKAGIRLVIVSATRNFYRQKEIWEAKWNGKRLVDGKDLSKTLPDAAQRALKILEYSSMPGTSRHHWGSDIDINSVEPAYFQTQEGKKLYAWLVANAPKFGFCQPYSPKGDARPNGYNEEKWHWSYLPISIPLVEFARKNLKDSLIAGFAGASAAPKIEVVKNYVLGINPACLEN